MIYNTISLTLIKTYFCFRSKSISFDYCGKDNKEFKLCWFSVKKIETNSYENVFCW